MKKRNFSSEFNQKSAGHNFSGKSALLSREDGRYHKYRRLIGQIPAATPSLTTSRPYLINIK
ncbi:hypothetical protein D5F51_11260 [Yersinia hibernica]|uniref:Uncharacterized protein n=1 Tax=Yersinia hibernica TaxID=2339259 RepID=A0ABX5R173_9GAMM|nr:hypothetical protein D5F51_11260 [Yersinia hibernica]